MRGNIRLSRYLAGPAPTCYVRSYRGFHGPQTGRQLVHDADPVAEVPEELSEALGRDGLPSMWADHEVGGRLVLEKSCYRKFVAGMVCIAQFGFAIVLLLLAAKNATILLNFLFNIQVRLSISHKCFDLFQINFCYLIGIVGLIVWPVTMLKSPMHFW